MSILNEYQFLKGVKNLYLRTLLLSCSSFTTFMDNEEIDECKGRNCLKINLHVILRCTIFRKKKNGFNLIECSG